MFGKFLVKLLKARKKGQESKVLAATIPTNLPSLLRLMLIAVVTITVATLLIRLSQCLPQFKSKRKKRVPGFNVRTMVVFGSGGHTTEMIMLLQKVPWFRFGPVHCILAQTDTTSKLKVENAKVGALDGCRWHTISRSREVKQSWITTIFTTMMSIVDAFYLVWNIRPSLIICNGPGTCVPICFVAFLYKILGFLDPDIVFVESFCRVQKLSLTGRLLYYIADKFIVQWTQLLVKNPRAEYLGDFVKSNYEVN